jgi:UDP-glucose 4-epimerase
LVTGGAGYIGSELVNKLIQLDQRVLVLDNFSRGKIENLRYSLSNPQFELIKGDISNKTTWSNILRNYEVQTVVHLAAVPGLDRCRANPKEALLTNFLGTHNVLEFCRSTNVRKFIFSSSGAVYGSPQNMPISEEHPLAPTNIYGISKLSGEKLVEAAHENYNLETIILRFGNIYGVGQFTYYETVIPKFVRQAFQEGNLTIYGDGNQGRDFIHINDIINAIILSLQAQKFKTNQIFNVGSGTPISINTLADVIRQEMKKHYNKDITMTYCPVRKGEPTNPDYCYDVKKIRDILNFKTDWTVYQGISQILSKMKKTIES